MPRRLICLLAMTGVASAESIDTPVAALPADVGDQGIGGAIGVAAGGRSTAGGLRLAGHYFYQLSDVDWFDGSASFVFGSGGAECFRDRMDVVICDHGLADGYEVEISANVRRYLPALANETFLPFLRAGLGVALVRFSDDEITGIAFPLHLGAGLRVGVADGIAVTGQADLEIGLARFSDGLGGEPQLGLNIMAGAEFRL